MNSYNDMLQHQADLFKSRVKHVDAKDVAFRRKLERANREISQLDTMIMVYRRKLMALDTTAADRHLRLRELKWMLMELQARAKHAQNLVDDLEEEHVNCVSVVESLVDQFEEMFPDMDEEDSLEDFRTQGGKPSGDPPS